MTTVGKLVKLSSLKIIPKYAQAVTKASDKEESDLENSIKIKGIETPLIVNQKYIVLDGHRRYKVAKKLGTTWITVFVKRFESKLEEYRFVCEANLNRRNMNEAQKIYNSQELYKIEKKLAQQRQKKGTLASSDAKGKTSHKVAKIIGISPSTYEKGQAVIKSKNKTQIDKWLDGTISTTSAYNNVQQIQYQQKTLVKLPKGKKPMLVEDPPWFYANFEASYNTGKTAAQYYPVMKLDELKKLDLGKLAAEDAVCMMWCTGPTMNWALELMASQGFTFKTIAFVWIKTKPTQKGKFIDIEKDIWFGLGNYTRSNAEYVLVGTRGKGLVRENKSVPQVYIGPVGKHSQKPKEIYRRIKKLYNVPAYECFAREPNKGFTPWGNEVKKKIKCCAICKNKHDPMQESCINYYKKLMEKTPGIEKCHNGKCNHTKNIHNTDYENQINGGSHCSFHTVTCGCERFIPKDYNYEPIVFQDNKALMGNKK